MKREGRQHGMVRSYAILPARLNPRPESRYVNRLNSPPTAGLFTKVSAKPTNHSKFTGKCGRPRCTACHIHPACKAKDKAKGTQKLRSCDAVSNYRLMTWRLVDSRSASNLSGFSATAILDHLAGDYMDHDDEMDEDGEDEYDEPSYGLAPPALIFDSEVSSRAVEIEEADDSDDSVNDNNGGEDEEDGMSFCDVGFVWEQIDEDEGWCLVEE